MKYTTKNEHGGWEIDARKILSALNKLSDIEEEGPGLVKNACDGYCKYADMYAGKENGQELLMGACEECPLSRLAGMIEEEGDE